MSNAGHTPQRTCLGCQDKKAKSELIRFVLQNGSVKIDINAAFPGRGAYICKKELCLETAVKRNAFHRAFRQDVQIDAERVFKEFSECLKKKS